MSDLETNFVYEDLRAGEGRGGAKTPSSVTAGLTPTVASAMPVLGPREHVRLLPNARKAAVCGR